MTKNIHKALLNNGKDYVMIIFGLMLYALGFTAFILPHEIVIGGVSGIGTLVYFGSHQVIPVAVTQYVCNLLLLAMAFKIVGKTFVTRTIFGATVISLFVGFFENFFMSLGHPIIADISMSAILGGIFCGLGVGTAFIHNGSSGGTDIVAAMVSKKTNVTVGRTMLYTDCVIISSSYFIFHQIDKVVYGLVVTFLVSFMADQVILTNRQAIQFTIISQHWAEIADAINNEAHRGCTVLDGIGWYTKHEMKVLLVMCRKIESVTIFRIVKAIDNDAFITQANVNGVYGRGFDMVKLKMKTSKNHKSTINLPAEGKNQ